MKYAAYDLLVLRDVTIAHMASLLFVHLHNFRSSQCAINVHNAKHPQPNKTGQIRSSTTPMLYIIGLSRVLI